MITVLDKKTIYKQYTFYFVIQIIPNKIYIYYSKVTLSL